MWVDQTNVSDDSECSEKKIQELLSAIRLPRDDPGQCLDLLKGLKHLQIVGLDDMEIYIDGDSGHCWFAETWRHAKISTTQHTLI
jgi:hypothetical protein